MTFAPTANRLYGAGPPVAPVAGMPAANGNAGRPVKSAAAMAVPSPDAGAAPRAADSVSNLFDDPTFWLVATVGAVLFLASASA